MLGRQRERATLGDLLEVVRAGRGGTLVLRGEAGIGKTALLDYAAQRPTDARIVRLSGAESEKQLAFAALQRLCAPMLDLSRRLPGRQRDALGVALGLTTGPAPDRFVVGLAVLGLLSEASAQRPQVCLIDDAQWVDAASLQVLAFVARRLQAEPVAMLFATRGGEAVLDGLPQLHVRGLRDEDAEALLDAAMIAPVDRQVRARIIAEARGNPLALLELARATGPDQLAGGFAVPDLPTPAARIETIYARRLAALPADSRLLVLIAAAEPLGDPVLVWRAATLLGIGPEAAGAAQSAGLLAIAGHVAFRHPLVRSAVYHTAPHADRRAVHRALAEATDPQRDPDRRAWHLAKATLGPDERVAEELERCATRARSRGGMAGAAAFLTRSAHLTIDPARRARRMLAAGEATMQAGGFDAALELAAAAEAGPLAPDDRARTDLLRGRIAFARDFGSQASALLLRAAAGFGAASPVQARSTYLEALGAALIAGRLSGGAGLAQAARAALSAPPPPGPPAPADLLLDGFARLITAGYPAGAPILAQAVHAFRTELIGREEGLRWLWLAGHAAGLLWDFDSWEVISERFVGYGREAGMLAILPVALSTRAGAHLFAGEFAKAAVLADEQAAIAEVTGSGIAPYGALGEAAFRGQVDRAAALTDAGTKDALDRGEGVGLSFIQWATALLHNGTGEYGQALAAARDAARDEPAQRFRNWGLAELIEAASRVGETDEAASALERLAAAGGTSDWALGIRARCRALLTADDRAEDLYREAMDRLGRTRLRPDLARAHLQYGEWLRRQRRQSDARGQLQRALDLFTQTGMAGFAQRTRTELAATGVRTRRPGPGTQGDLTAQELRICRLVAQGETNNEIATRLFISPRTVEYHLHKAFHKLGVTSRTQLARRLPEHEDKNSP
ncbi:helix-turn-helix transcriptional regulator [Streptomyces sp. NPDC002514]|uniref:helix-turn-helix transcriptional regulator n=1 Tax=Streptomyces sp. NPDC001270 TaxID=3364554 RepID=UPI0036B86ECC